MHLKGLRAFLGLATVTWGAAIPGVFLSWNTATAAMEGFGAGPLVYDKMLDYWLRMVCGAFGLIGCLYLLPTIQPRRFREFIPWLGLLALVEGLVLIVHGFRLGLRPWPFYGDFAACLVSGVGILSCWRAARGELCRNIVEPNAPPNGGPAEPVANSGVCGGPPSVS
jgi:hypothetical protein